MLYFLGNFAWALIWVYLAKKKIEGEFFFFFPPGFNIEIVQLVIFEYVILITYNGRRSYKITCKLKNLSSSKHFCFVFLIHLRKTDNMIYLMIPSDMKHDHVNLFSILSTG